MDLEMFSVAEVDLICRWMAVHSVPQADGCVKWSGRMHPSGYGLVPIPGGAGTQKPEVQAHRMAYLLNHGHIPTKFFVCHECDNRDCIASAHLWLGTPAANSVDMAIKGRHGMARRAKGLHRHAARITPDTAREVVRLCREGVPRKSVAVKLDVTAVMISEIMSGRTWSDETGIPYQPKHRNLAQIFGDNPLPPKRKYTRKSK